MESQLIHIAWLIRSTDTPEIQTCDGFCCCQAEFTFLQFWWLARCTELTQKRISGTAHTGNLQALIQYGIWCNYYYTSSCLFTILQGQNLNENDFHSLAMPSLWQMVVWLALGSISVPSRGHVCNGMCG